MQNETEIITQLVELIICKINEGDLEINQDHS